jgi:hypothetical protein
MSDYDRGAYTPQTDAPLSFDARRASGGGGPVPMTLLISGMVLVVLVIGVVYFYRSGVRPTGHAAPQVVGAPVGATKAPPPSSEQPNDEAAGLQVYKREITPLSQAQNMPTAPRFTPAPEQPEPRPAAKPVTVQSAPLPPVAAPVHAAPAPAPAPVAVAAAKPAAKATPKLAPIAPTPVSTAPAEPKASTPAPVSAKAPGGALVQIGAFSSAALADKGWHDVAKAMPSEMSGKTKAVQVIDKDGTTFYRTSVAGFASHADAVSFCMQLKAAGKSCLVK